MRPSVLSERSRPLLASTALAERGSDGQLNVLYWQAMSIMTPYLSGGIKDLEAASLVIEPLARYNEKGDLVPYLAQEIPTAENGGVSADLTTITWKLKEGLLWSDGSPVTAEDAVFTWQYLHRPGRRLLADARISTDVKSIEAVDPQTIKVTFLGAETLPLRAAGRRTGADHPEGAIRRLPRGQGAGVHARPTPIRSGPVRSWSKDFKANDVVAAGGQPELPRSGEARLRDPGAEGRRRRGLGGARGARDRRVRLCLERPGRARDPAADARPAGRAR